MRHVKSLKINTLLNVVKTCANIVFPLITFPYVSRVLLPENVGKVNFGSSYVSYFSLIASLGIATYAIRECSKVRDSKQQLEKTASQLFSINICTTIVAYVLLFVSLLLLRNLDNYRTLIIIQSTAILFTTLGADWLNSAMEDFAYITIRSVSFQFLSLVLMFLFVKTPDDYMKYAAITVLSSSGGNVANILYRRRYCRTRFTLDIEWRRHMKPIMLLFVMVLSQTIFNSADVTMLGLMQDDYAVGLYSTAAKIERLISQIVASIVFVLIPRLSYMFAEENYAKINELLRKVLGGFLLVGIPCFAGATVMAEEIILIIAGAEYIDAILPLQILMLSFLCSLVGGSFLGNVVLLSSGKEKKFMIICCVATVIKVLANFVFIPRYGVNAAAATTAFSSFLILLLLLLTVDKRIQIREKRELVTMPILGSVMIVISCILVKNFVSGSFLIMIAGVSSSVIVYAVLAIFMKNEIVYGFLGRLLKKRQ